MIRLSRKTEYGLMAVKYLSTMEQPVSCKEIADRLHVPLEILAKVLQRLAKGKLIRSARGSTGGYRLTKPKEQITLYDIVAAVERKVELTLCLGDHCHLCEACNIQRGVKTIQPKLVQFFSSITLRDF